MEHTRGNQFQAAKVLGIARQTLRRRLRELHITPRFTDAPPTRTTTPTDRNWRAACKAFGRSPDLEPTRSPAVRNFNPRTRPNRCR